ncbi:protein of unknown function [Clostridium amylolyticum]|uniref:DUF4179 domain-containing protein n=1 Tax=Clostridium amylolyticum TaxID=1121298 RepID=A0A1M6GIL9_9CLOT|nr:DUF4179 domain-containing protein [Clostridium amylolyticum]SHJ09779.1 protein of unknown function [Clostridium amylolyticum]
MDNNLFNIEIPTEKLDATINHSIQRGERYLKHKKFTKAAMAALFVGGFSLLNVAKPALAESIPVIGKVVQQLNTSLGINKDYRDYDKYAQTINKSSKDNGIEVKINDAILDNQNNLMLSYEIKSDKGFSEDEKKYVELNNTSLHLGGINRVDFQPNYKISSKKAMEIIGELSKDGKMLSLTEKGGYVPGKFTDNNTFVGIAQYDLSSFKNVPQTFKIKADINNIKFSYDPLKDLSDLSLKEISGNWNLEFTVKKSKIENIKTINPNVKSEHVIVKDITITPFTTDISVKIDFSKINKLKVVDENNKEYTNYNTINKKETDSNFSDITFRFIDINKDVKNLKLIFLNNNGEEVFSSVVSIE